MNLQWGFAIVNIDGFRLLIVILGNWLVLNRLRKYPPQITFIALEAANLNEITSSLAIMFFALKQNFTYPYQLF